MENVLEIVEKGSMILSGLVLVATVVVRFTPSHKDDEVVSKVARVFFKITDWLPTIGVNPHTKDLETAYKALKKEVKEEK